LFWFVLTIVVGQAVVLVIWLAERLGKEVSRNQFSQPRVRLAFSFLFALLVICTLYASFIEPNWLEVTEIKLSTTKMTKGEQITFAQLSDLHSTRQERSEKRLPQIVNRYQPDIICLTGDYLNNRDGINVVRKLVRQLKAKHGIFAVMGNRDVWYFADVPIFEDTKVIVLDGDSVRLKVNGGWIYIAGVAVENESALAQSLRKTKADRFYCAALSLARLN
ncbi:MAG: metallophosphoesterase, partial [Armatimonadota bacterium]